MDIPYGYIRPESLKTTEAYFLREGSANRAEATFVSVRFVSNTACPAIIIVSSVGGIKVRCLRDDLFVPCRPNACGETAIDVQPDILEITT